LKAVLLQLLLLGLPMAILREKSSLGTRGHGRELWNKQP